MTAKELKELMVDLIRKYYLSYINNDVDGMASIKNKINELIVIYDDADEIKQYFNYCIALYSNMIVETVIKNGGLLKPFKTGSDKEFETIHDRIQKNIEYFKALESEMNEC